MSKEGPITIFHECGRDRAPGSMSSVHYQNMLMQLGREDDDWFGGVAEPLDVGWKIWQNTLKNVQGRFEATLIRNEDGGLAVSQLVERNKPGKPTRREVFAYSNWAGANTEQILEVTNLPFAYGISRAAIIRRVNTAVADARVGVVQFYSPSLWDQLGITVEDPSTAALAIYQQSRITRVGVIYPPTEIITDRIEMRNLRAIDMQVKFKDEDNRVTFSVTRGGVGLVSHLNTRTERGYVELMRRNPERSITGSEIGLYSIPFWYRY